MANLIEAINLLIQGMSLDILSQETAIQAIQESMPVDSSVIDNIAYNPQGKILTVDFNSGTIYQYYNVPESVYEAFLAASSKGEFLNNTIKQRFFPYVRIN